MEITLGTSDKIYGNSQQVKTYKITNIVRRFPRHSLHSAANNQLILFDDFQVINAWKQAPNSTCNFYRSDINMVVRCRHTYAS